MEILGSSGSNLWIFVIKREGDVEEGSKGTEEVHVIKKLSGFSPEFKYDQPETLIKW